MQSAVADSAAVPVGGRPWKCQGGGKNGKPNPGFPSFPPPLENPAEPTGFSHFHRHGVHRLEKWKTKKRFPTFPPGARDNNNGSLSVPKKPKKGSRPPRGLIILLSRLRSSGTDFMLILQLENAVGRRNSQPSGILGKMSTPSLPMPTYRTPR
jgi:hypothetical protein